MHCGHSALTVLDDAETTQNQTGFSVAPRTWMRRVHVRCRTRREAGDVQIKASYEAR